MQFESQPAPPNQHANEAYKDEDFCSEEESQHIQFDETYNVRFSNQARGIEILGNGGGPNNGCFSDKNLKSIEDF